MVWPTKRLSEVTRRLGGGTPSREEESYWGDGLPWFTVADLKDIENIQTLSKSREGITITGLENSAAKRVPAGAVVFSSRVVVGKVGIAANDLATNQDFSSFVACENLDREFLAYFLIKAKGDLRGHQRGATIKGVTTQVLDALEVPIPNMAEQRRIVARIKESMVRVDEMEALRATVIKDAEGLGSAVFADYVESLDLSRIASPALGEVIIECTYGTSQKANENGEGDPVLRMGNIQDGRLDITNLKHVQLPPKERSKYLLADGDILINRTNSLELVGKSAVFTGLKGNWIFASYLIRLRVNRSKTLPEYVNAIINSRIGRNYVLRTARRAIGMVNINAKEIQRMPLPLPPLEVQQAIMEHASNAAVIVNQVNGLLAEDGASRLRESILRKAFAGGL